MPNFLPFSLMNNPFSSPFFPNPSYESLMSFNQNPFHKLSDSLENMHLKPQKTDTNNHHQIYPEEMQIISLSHLENDNIETKEHLPFIGADIFEGRDENTPNFINEKPCDFKLKKEFPINLNLTVRNFAELNPQEKISKNLKMALINLEKNEVYFLNQNNNSNLTSDSSNKSGSYISINNSNTSNSLSAKFDSNDAVENMGNADVRPDPQKRSKFVKFTNNE